MSMKDSLLHPNAGPLRIGAVAVAGLAALQVAAGAGQTAVLGLTVVLITVAVAILIECYLQVTNRRFDTGLIQTMFLLSRDEELFPFLESMAGSLLQTSNRTDPIYRTAAIDQLQNLARQHETVASGTIEFSGTETWRLVYEQLLRSPGLHSYRSVSWVRSEDYWQDGPGRQSVKLNAELQSGQRVTVERIVILADSLWPSDREPPAERIRQWFHEQHSDGIWIGLVRESALTKERDLLQDIGIYGSRAIGTQEFDENSQPVRFTIQFDFSEITAAEDRWKRLSVYATSYQDFLDQVTLDE
ncbi:MAG: hypothetical protein ACYTGL_25630 [Planctomycetota bacterium]|jgi:hypothetical protein